MNCAHCLMRTEEVITLRMKLKDTQKELKRLEDAKRLLELAHENVVRGARESNRPTTMPKYPDAPPSYL